MRQPIAHPSGCAREPSPFGGARAAAVSNELLPTPLATDVRRAGSPIPKALVRNGLNPRECGRPSASIDPAGACAVAGEYMSPIVITPRRIGDDRGWFSETYNARRLAEHGIVNIFCQDNQS